MEKYRQEPKCEVISARVTDEEKKLVRALAAKNNVSVTDLMRSILITSGILNKDSELYNDATASFQTDMFNMKNENGFNQCDVVKTPFSFIGGPVDGLASIFQSDERDHVTRSPSEVKAC